MKKFLIFSLAVASLTGCGGGGGNNNNGSGAAPSVASVDANGNCTAAFINDHNAYADAYNKLSKEKSADNVNALKRACDSFRSRHNQSISCLSKERVFAADVYSDCTKLDQALKPSTDASQAPDCTDQFVTDYKDVAVAAFTYTSKFSSGPADSSEVKTKCESFKKRNDESVICLGQKMDSGTNTPVRAVDIYDLCSKVDKMSKQ